MCDSWGRGAVLDKLAELAVFTGCLVVWFDSHRSISVQKVTFLKLLNSKDTNKFILWLYYVWTYIIENKTALFWDITQRAVWITYLRFEITCWPPLKGSFLHLVSVTYQRFEKIYWSIFNGKLSLSDKFLQTFRDKMSVTSWTVILTPDWPLKID